MRTYEKFRGNTIGLYGRLIDNSKFESKSSRGNFENKFVNAQSLELNVAFEEYYLKWDGVNTVIFSDKEDSCDFKQLEILIDKVISKEIEGAIILNHIKIPDRVIKDIEKKCNDNGFEINLDDKNSLIEIFRK